MHRDDETSNNDYSRNSGMTSGYNEYYDVDRNDDDDDDDGDDYDARYDASADLEAGHYNYSNHGGHNNDHSYTSYPHRDDERKRLSRSRSRSRSNRGNPSRRDKHNKKKTRTNENFAGITVDDNQRRMGSRSTSRTRRGNGRTAFDGEQSITVSELQLNRSVDSIGNPMDGSRDSDSVVPRRKERRRKSRAKQSMSGAHDSISSNDYSYQRSRLDTRSTFSGHDSISSKNSGSTYGSHHRRKKGVSVSFNDSGDDTSSYQRSRFETLSGHDSDTISLNDSGDTRYTHQRSRVDPRSKRPGRFSGHDSDTISLNDSGNTRYTYQRSRRKRSGRLSGHDSISSKSSGGTCSNHRRRRDMPRQSSEKYRGADPAHVHRHDESRYITERTPSEQLSRLARGRSPHQQHRIDHCWEQPLERQRCRSNGAGRVYRRSNSAGPLLRKGRSCSVDRSLANCNSHCDDAFPEPCGHDTIASRQPMKRSNSAGPLLRRGHSCAVGRSLENSHCDDDAFLAPHRHDTIASRQPPPTMKRSRSLELRRNNYYDRYMMQQGTMRRGCRPSFETSRSGNGFTRPSIERRPSHGSRPSIERRPSHGSRPSMDRRPSHTSTRPPFETSTSRPSMDRRPSRASAVRPSMEKSRSKSATRSGGHGTREFYYDEQGRRFVRVKEPKRNGGEKLSSRTLAFIWIIVAAELGFDLATTIIAFLSFVREGDCCGESIELVQGNIPLGITIPFFVLVMIELLTLIRIIILTLWPGIASSSDDDNAGAGADNDGGDDEVNPTSVFGRFCCYCLKMNAKALMATLNCLFLLNPIFGCMIAWMLMYQSDKKEAFTVLGFEGASLVLHFASVCLEGSFRTSKEIMLHLTPIIPFLVSIGMVGYYIKQGGVCYLPQEKLFRFYGCEICYVDGVPEPCRKGFTDLWGSDGLPSSLQDIGSIITKRTDQSTYCSANVSFCFFNYTTGIASDVNIFELESNQTIS